MTPNWEINSDPLEITSGTELTLIRHSFCIRINEISGPIRGSSSFVCLTCDLGPPSQISQQSSHTVAHNLRTEKWELRSLKGDKIVEFAAAAFFQSPQEAIDRRLATFSEFIAC